MHVHVFSALVHCYADILLIVTTSFSDCIRTWYLTLCVLYFALVLRNFPIGTTSFPGFVYLIVFNPLNAIFCLGGLDNFTIFPTGCNHRGSVASFLCNSIFKLA